MATMKVVQVFPQPRLWGDKFPDNCSVNLLFEDGSMGEVATKKDKFEEVKARLVAVLNQDAEFELEAKPDYQGQKQFKITNYPGKPASQGLGGGRPYTPAFNHTREGFLLEQKYMNARTSIMQAVALIGPGQDAKIGKELSTLAKGIFKVLCEMVPEPASVPTTTAPAQTTAYPQAARPEQGDEESDPFE